MSQKLKASTKERTTCHCDRFTQTSKYRHEALSAAETPMRRVQGEARIEKRRTTQKSTDSHVARK